MTTRRHRRSAPIAIGLLIAVLAGCAAAVPQPARPVPAPDRPAGVAATDCFPFERLPERLRSRARDLLLNALDGEALYTIGADLKPMSSGFYSVQIAVGNPDLREAEDVRQVLEAWTCGGELTATLHHFAAVYEGRRFLEGVVFNLPAMRQLLERRAGFFAGYGVTRSADPLEALFAVEYDATSARLRGYGYFFGYPDYAVDFFVKAADDQNVTGTLVPRDFLSLPTARGERRFVYATPKGHQPNEADAALKAAVDRVFADYMARRAKHIAGNDSSNVLALVREWFDDGRGVVKPSNVWRTPVRR
ncbi:MAG TPA: hypothetical protein VFO19_08430 [Vicinamibacterales bacterium]|nr:hypothetical protein [Vicinamibacterales bacterium]